MSCSWYTYSWRKPRTSCKSKKCTLITPVSVTNLLWRAAHGAKQRKAKTAGRKADEHRIKIHWFFSRSRRALKTDGAEINKAVIHSFTGGDRGAYAVCSHIFICLVRNLLMGEIEKHSKYPISLFWLMWKARREHRFRLHSWIYTM